MAGRIVIADEVSTHRIYLRALLNSAGYEVIEAQNAEHVVPLVKQFSPEIVILDDCLSSPPSSDICHTINQDPSLRKIPIMVLTARQSAEARLEILQSGADEVIHRPISDSVLRAKIRNMRRMSTMLHELDEREATTAQLGFADAQAKFMPPLRIVAVEADVALREDWLDEIRAIPNSIFEHLDIGELLAQLARSEAQADLILLPPDLLADYSGLTIISELRASEASRYSAIVMAHNPEDRGTAVAALDLGANDLIETDSTVSELRLRMSNQLELKSKGDRLRGAMERGMHLAVTDALTGLYNRRYALPHLARIAKRSASKDLPYAVLVLDIDRFKRINDDYGHSAGDLVLSEIAQLLKQNLRNIDLLARIGGEEFLVVLPDTDKQAAQNTAERLRGLIASTPIPIGQSATQVLVTVSIGMALGGPEVIDNVPIEDVFNSADMALLSAKAHGRNMVEIESCAA